jgi:cytochrome c peroxidase
VTYGIPPTRRLGAFLAGLIALWSTFGIANAAPAASDTPALADFGRALFFDPNLSATRTQSCASCHDPSRAFSDGRDNGVGAAVSIGADGRALGDRNAPSITYAALVPPFTREEDGRSIGGLFRDGRAHDLTDQAGQPMLNPIEMGMRDVGSVAARVREKAAYVATIEALFGAGTPDSDDAVFAAIESAIAAYEQTAEFVAFDSRYDRFLAGQEQLTREEELGRMLFFSSLTNCASCHVLDTAAPRTREAFTGHRYFNIGVPVNAAVRALNGRAPGADLGLRANPQVTDDAQTGKFRVPTLRNVAVTAPYMHNGVFRRLATVVHFYNQYLAASARNATNPETGLPWGPAEVPATVDHELLRAGQPMDDARVTAIVAFLRTLTDKRFEPLLDPGN